MFVAGGLTGIMFLAIPFDQQATDTYFVVAHFHYIIFGAAVFPIFGGMYFWFPKVTGRMYVERLGQASFWILFAGTNLLFFPMHIVGLLGMPRRVYTYPGDMGWTAYNVVETVGGYLTALGILVVFANLVWSYRRGPEAPVDPWNAPTLEWSTSSPPPEYNFARIPVVASAYPRWEPSGEAVVTGDQPISSFVDGVPEGVVEPPHSSPWPIVLSLVLLGVFALLVIEKFMFAAILLVVAALVLVAWHADDVPSPLARWGTAMLIATEAALFALLIGSYFLLRFKNVHWPPRGIPEPQAVVPLVLLGVLVLSVLPLTRHGRRWVLLALLVQAGYFAMEVRRYADDLRAFTPQEHAYGSLYYTLLGASHAHVAVGLLLSAWLLWRYSENARRAIALYWYAVVVLTVAVTLTVLSPGLA
jgi:heme/copper-type cytochrome/quinol oxidase subunit 3